MKTITENYLKYWKRMKGRKLSEETCRRMSISRMGHPNYLKKQTEEARLKISNATRGEKNPNWGKSPSLEIRQKLREHNLGKKLSKETRLKMKLHPNRSGSGHFNWKGGITPHHVKIRNTEEMRLWRKAVFQRDNWTCQECNVRGGSLHAHHIKPFAWFPELRTAIDNGVTLCKSCHKQTDTYAGKMNRKT